MSLLCKTCYGLLCFLSVAVGPSVCAAETTVEFGSDFSAPLSGQTSLTYKVNYDSVLYDQWYYLTVDGAQVHHTNVWNPQTAGTRQASFVLDTTSLGDGEHVLQFIGWGTTNPNDGKRYFLTAGRRTFATENKKAVRDIDVRWSELRLKPGESVAIEPRDLLADGGLSARPVSDYSYSSSNPAVVSVSPGGRAEALTKGAVTVTVARNGRARDIAVVVDGPSDGFPHLAKDGGVLRSYNPARSRIIRSMFNLGPEEIRSQPGLLDKVKDAGINALDEGFYIPPNDGNTSVEHYLEGARQAYDRALIPTKEQGLMFVAGGDNWARGSEALGVSLTNPFAAAGTKYALERLRDSGIVPMLEVVDEATGILGVKAPDQIVQLMKMFDAVPGRTPAGWSIFSLHGSDAIAGWEAETDYHSWMFSNLDWEWSDSGYSLVQWSKALRGRVIPGRAVADNAKPLAITNVSSCGPFYTKLVDSENYVPGRDGVQGLEVPPEAITVQIMSALAYGASAIRVYSYDSPRWQTERRTAAIGTSALQTGAAPAGFGAGNERWAAVRAAFRAIGALEPELLQPSMSAVDPGPGFLAGARGGQDSRVLIVVSTTNRPSATATVDLSSYRAGGFRPVSVLSVWRGESSESALSDTTVDRPVLRAGEARLYVLRRNTGAPAVPANLRVE